LVQAASICSCPIDSSIKAAMSPASKYASLAFFGFLALAYAVLFLWTWAQYPFLPPQADNASWAALWLLTWVVNYYTAAFCLCAVIVASESCGAAALWSFLILAFGAPFACAYIVYRVTRTRTLSLEPPPSYQGTISSDMKVLVCQVIYSALGLAFFLRLGWTLYTYGLFPLRTDDPEWGTEWVITTIGDFASAAACLWGIMLFTEATAAAFAWIVLSVVGGGVGTCAYMIYRLVNFDSIALMAKEAEEVQIADDTQGA